MGLSLTLPNGVGIRDLLSILTTPLLSAAQRPVLPSLKHPPKGINPEALNTLWPAFVEKYEDTWERSPTVEKKWACCVAIWINYCLKRKVQPFSVSPDTETVNADTQEKLDTRIKSARADQLNAVDSLADACALAGIFKKKYKEVFYSVEQGQGEFTILTKIKMTLNVPFISKEFKGILRKKNFRKVDGGYRKLVKTNTSVFVWDSDKPNDAEIFLVNRVTQPYAENILNQRGESVESLKLGLTRYWKRIIKEFK